MKPILIKNGTLIPLDPRYGTVWKADLLIKGTTIMDIQADIRQPDAMVIDASDMLILPGFVDTHRHLWETQIRGIAADWTLGKYLQEILGKYAPLYRPEDVYLGNLLGCLEALDAGITTVLDWSHIMNSPDHTDEAIRGLWDSGIRAVFAHGNPGTDLMEWFMESQLKHPEDVRRVRTAHFTSENQRITMAMAIRGPEYSTMEVTKHDIQLARELGLRASMHVGGGTFGPLYKPIEQLYQANLLGPDLNFAHGCTLSEQEFSYIAESGGSISITPEVEMQMGLGLPATGRALAQGIRPSLGVDVVTSIGGNMFSQMKIALQTERALQNQRMLERQEMPQTVSIKARDVLEFATLEGARALGLEHKIGSLTPGKEADLVFLKMNSWDMIPTHDPIGQIVLSAGVHHVDTVIVGGRILKKNGKLVGLDLEALKRKALQSSDYILNQ